jgi:hypothetical protein
MDGADLMITYSKIPNYIKDHESRNKRLKILYLKLNSGHARNRLLTELPDFGMRPWAWEDSSLLKSQKGELLSYKLDGFKKLREEAIAKRAKFICFVIFPTVLALLFLVLEIYVLSIELIDRSKIGTIITIVAAFMAFFEVLRRYMNKRLKSNIIARKEILKFLGKVLDEKKIEELNKYIKPTKLKITTRLALLLIYFGALAFPFKYH